MQGARPFENIWLGTIVTRSPCIVAIAHSPLVPGHSVADAMCGGCDGHRTQEGYFSRSLRFRTRIVIVNMYGLISLPVLTHTGRRHLHGSAYPRTLSLSNCQKRPFKGISITI